MFLREDTCPKASPQATPPAQPTINMHFNASGQGAGSCKKGAAQVAEVRWWVSLPTDNSRSAMTGSVFLPESHGTMWTQGDVQCCLQLNIAYRPRSQALCAGYSSYWEAYCFASLWMCCMAVVGGRGGGKKMFVGERRCLTVWELRRLTNTASFVWLQ